MCTLIEIKDLARTYERGKQKVEVLHHVNLDIAEGDCLALMGPSGSGKTTLLNLIGGLDAPSAGSISVGGQRIDQLGGGALAKWRASNVGFVFHLTALEGRCACLLGHHGMLVFVRDPEHALDLAVELETLCEQYWRTLQIAVPQRLTLQQMEEVLEKFRSYGQQDGD